MLSLVWALTVSCTHTGPTKGATWDGMWSWEEEEKSSSLHPFQMARQGLGSSAIHGEWELRVRWLDGWHLEAA